MELQRDAEVAEAKRGRVSLPFGFWALAWSILLALIGAAMSIGIAQSNVALRLQSLELQVATTSARIERHIEAPGHVVVIERVDQIKKRLDDIESRRTSRGGQ